MGAVSTKANSVGAVPMQVGVQVVSVQVVTLKAIQ